MAFNIHIYSAADYDNGSIPIEEEDTNFLSGFEARNTQNALYPSRPITSDIPESDMQESNIFTPNNWRPSRELLKTKQYLNSVQFFYYPCMPCCHCSKLLTPDEVKWVPFDNNFTYNLLICFPQVSLFHHPSDSQKIACCKTCNDARKRRLPPQLDSIPTEISHVPMFHRRWLSPIYLSCSLGRSENSNPFTTFRHLSGTFNLSRNKRAHALYTGDMGAIFTENNGSMWFHHTLVCAAQWLSTHNHVIRNKGYALFQSQAQSQSISTFPTATLITPTSTNINNNVQSLRPSAVVVPPFDLNPEIHNEHFHYNRLIAGSVRTTDGTEYSISYADPDLEALIFPHLFPHGRGHYKYYIQNLPKRPFLDTYHKWIKLCLLCPDPRFREDWYWPFWTYINLEKLRNHQYHTRLLRQKGTDRDLHPRGADLISQSVYNGRPIINENVTTTLPSFIRTGQTFFYRKGLQLNTIIQSFGLPQILYTTTMAEGHWKHLQIILSKTDSCDPLPSNRPLHAYLHYQNRLQTIEKYLWKKPALAGWGKWIHSWERDEFQNRGAIHTHGIAWLSLDIPSLIAKDIIRADVPDSEQEPELFDLVMKHQIHTCSPQKCGGPLPNGMQCKKHFPQPLS